MKQQIIFNRNFAFIWSASLLSGIGDSIMSIAVLWGVYSFTQSPIALGIVTLAQLLPIIIFSFYSGVLADTYSTKKIMIYSDIARFLLLLFLIIFWSFGFNSKLILLYITVFFYLFSLLFLIQVFKRLSNKLLGRKILSMQIVGFNFLEISQDYLD